MKDHDHEHSDNAFDGFTMDQIKKNFSALARELEDGGRPIQEVYEEAEEPQSSEKPPRVFQGYNPTIKDFLARASTVEECEEIIDYCLKQGDITAEEAQQLLYRLERGGPRAFGTRLPGYYDRNQ